MTALLFGSFNPIHNGHISIAHYTLEQGLADEVWFVVSPQNPLKDSNTLASYDNRVDMVRLAISDESRFKVCEIERTLPHPSYTINTIEELYRLYPDEKFMILAGSDIKEQLPLWREYERLQQIVQFMVYPRGKDSINCSSEMASAPLMDIDSTSCRQNLYPLSEATKKALPTSVIEYIVNHDLYHTAEQRLYESGCEHYKHGEFGAALNDFNDALALNPEFHQARHMKEMTESILNFRHTDIYNP